jgi:hypothetical protein
MTRPRELSLCNDDFTISLISARASDTGNEMFSVLFDAVLRGGNKSSVVTICK